MHHLDVKVRELYDEIAKTTDPKKKEELRLKAIEEAKKCKNENGF